MSQIPSNWSRWIYASVAKHFVTALSPIHAHVEGFPRQTDDKSEWIEIRVDGPYYREQGKGNFFVDCEINIAVCVIEQEDNNAYRIHEINGLVAAAFLQSIPVNKYGPSSDPANDGTHLGCLTQQTGDREKIHTSFFGKIRPDTDMLQATVEGHYRIQLSI